MASTLRRRQPFWLESLRNAVLYLAVSCCCWWVVMVGAVSLIQVFAERIVVKAFVKSLAGEGDPPAPTGTRVRAVLHEGLV